MSDTRSPACDSCSARRDFLRRAVGATVLAGLGTLPVHTLSALASASPSPASGAPRATLKYPVPAADGVSVDSANEVILCRSAGEVFAFALSCPHQNTALKVLPKNAGFQCPKHKSKYKSNGTFISGRATRNMDRLQITRDANLVVVDPNVAFESDSDPARWAAAVVKL
jgi:nitrite reductase/ring-hydroxylating ferredoxin subunit